MKIKGPTLIYEIKFLPDLLLFATRYFIYFTIIAFFIIGLKNISIKKKKRIGGLTTSLINSPYLSVSTDRQIQ